MVEKSAWAGQGVSPHPHPQPSFCLPPSTIFVGASRPSPGIVTAHANTTYGPRVTGDPCKSQVNDVTFFSGNFFLYVYLICSNRAYRNSSKRGNCCEEVMASVVDSPLLVSLVIFLFFFSHNVFHAFHFGISFPKPLATCVIIF